MDVLSTRPLPDGLVGVIVMFDVQRRASMGEIAFDCEDGRYRYLGLSYGPLGEDAASETRGYSDSLLADDLRKVTLFPVDELLPEDTVHRIHDYICERR